MPDTVGIIPPILYLKDAYERVYSAMNPHFRELQARLTKPGTREDWDKHDHAELCANEVLRNAIEQGSLTPLVYRKGKPRQLPREGWKIPGQFPRQDWMPNCFPQTGIYSNLVGPNDPTNPGPPTGRNGKCREVFFDRIEFELWLQSLFPTQCSQSAQEEALPVRKVIAETRRGGKKKGDGSFFPVDQPLLEEMDMLLRERKAASSTEAARMLAAGAHGAGTPESKASRLGKRHRQLRARAAIAP